jgi:mannose/cellobiose epimerase-like protein (N-acyl-D-glucosamine 2-epimerase family)
VALRTTLEQSYAHPLGGFNDDHAGVLPHRSKSHMHLLEAALAWIAVDDEPAWRGLADGIAALCLEKFIDPANGALREFFADDWSPVPGVEGRICEPGHHYEWAFLLDRWVRLTSRNTPEAVPRLVAFADSHGLDACRGVAINAILADGSIHDPALVGRRPNGFAPSGGPALRRRGCRGRQTITALSRYSDTRRLVRPIGAGRRLRLRTGARN